MPARPVLEVSVEARSEQARVRFASGPAVPARSGESLLKIAEANRVGLRSGCRMGLCGADPVWIVAGQDSLSPPSAAERATLQRLGLPPGCRLACTARVRAPLAVALGSDDEASPGRVPGEPLAITLGARDAVAAAVLDR